MLYDLLGDAKVAIEVKISDRLRGNSLNGLTAFIEEYKPIRAILVNNSDSHRIVEINNYEVEVMPWRVFLEQLWNKKIIND